MASNDKDDKKDKGSKKGGIIAIGVVFGLLMLFVSFMIFGKRGDGLSGGGVFDRAHLSMR